MSDPLVEQLTRELGRRASDMTADPALASLVLGRARIVRRRRSVAVTAAAAVAVAAVILAVAGPGEIRGIGPTPPAVRTPAPVAPKVVAPQAGPIRIPYVINGRASAAGLLDPAGSPARAAVHLDGHTVQLPAHWNVLSASRAGDGVLVRVALAPYPTAETKAVVAYVSPAGEITQLPDLSGGAFPVNADGSLVLGRAMTLTTAATTSINFVQLPSATVTHAPGLPAGYSLVGPVGPGSVLVDEDAVRLYQVWTAATGAVSTVPAISAGITGDWLVVAADRTGQVLLAGTQGLRDIRIDPPVGSWTSTVTAATILQAGPRFSPDGTRIALVSGGRLLVLSTTDGSVLARSAPFPTSADISSIGWEDGATVLAQTDAALTTHSQVFRCSASGGQCLNVTAPSGQLILAAQ
jgi:hypothetical protein